ncbi:hypothetical protein [Acuticoccus sediminis]|uniref:hypothetical protein n=1 Tax=Acuticoccus sediminis TaxID=2184697 RepID=UPI001CFD4D4D|nr:hypothetical protein [Acuticoccus sediminis]
MAVRQGLTVVALASVLAAPAAAQSGRFQMEPSGPNILRLDRETGEIASCSAGDSGWVCETLVPAKDAEAPATALLDENRRLKARVEVLERRLGQIAAIARGGAEIGANADGEAGPAPVATESPDDRIDVEKARRDIDDAVEVTGYALRSFRGLVDALTAGTN